jgi:2,4-dienoyl-CoA reductase-like NADH-dependent reductase (Old Yellow Enzyme family)
MAKSKYTKVAQLKTVEAFRARLQELEIEIPVDDEILTTEQGSPAGESFKIGDFEVGNRYCIHPMEGWDANHDGTASDLTKRRWQRFGESGAKLIWGGEAMAVQPDGRANANQLMAIESSRDSIRELRETLESTHREHFGTTEDLLVGAQLTHSGRFCRPNTHELEPRIAYHHPLLAEKYGLDPSDDSIIWTDDDLEKLIDSYVAAAKLASEIGFRFVDVKACHGYLLHEFLSARSRPGKFGGDLDGRSRVLTTVIDRIHSEIPGLMVFVRLSAFDILPYKTSTEVGQPMESETPYQFGFGTSESNPLEYDLQEPLKLIGMLKEKGVAAVNLSCGSPYYNPHIQRPAIFPPSDGYMPPEDPLVGVARQMDVVRQFKQAYPDLPFVGSGYSYLQDYLPHVAQAAIREGWVDSIGLGRMVLSFPDLPASTLQNGEIKRKLICRTFSDCTTAPRNGIVSGCYPLDKFYKDMPEGKQLVELKKAAKKA